LNLFRAAEISLVCAFAAGLQVSAVKPQGAGLSQHLNAERFELVTSIRGLPLGIRDELQKMFGGSLDIVDPATQIESGPRSAAPAPTRRLRAAGCARDHHCLVYYELTGVAPGWRVALFHWTPQQTRLEAGGVAPGGLDTIDDVRQAILAGRVTTAETW
jgi:hypothetical protein